MGFHEQMEIEFKKNGIEYSLQKVPESRRASSESNRLLNEQIQERIKENNAVYFRSINKPY